jgi:Ca2+/Na+ antiporter
MNTTTALFYVFSAVLLFASFRVITARSTVHAALFLVLAFFSASCVWMLLRAEFLAITLVLVYVGAVMVLFLFVVMMLDINTDQFREGFWKHFPLAGDGGRGHRARDGLRADARLPAQHRRRRPTPSARQLGNTGCWASRSTPTTCTRCRSPRCCCWWPSSRPSR